MNLFLTIILIGMGILCAQMAQRRRRNPYFWFAIGFLFGLMGMACIYFLKPPKTLKRPPQPPEQDDHLAALPNVLWYYLDATRSTLGPMSLYKLKEEWKIGKIGPNTYVWNEKLENWKQIKEFTEPTSSL